MQSLPSGFCDLPQCSVAVDQRLSTWTSNISAVTGISCYLAPDKGLNKNPEKIKDMPPDLLRLNVSQHIPVIPSAALYMSTIED